MDSMKCAVSVDMRYLISHNEDVVPNKDIVPHEVAFEHSMILTRKPED